MGMKRVIIAGAIFSLTNISAAIGRQTSRVVTSIKASAFSRVGGYGGRWQSVGYHRRRRLAPYLFA